jgi:hypothetical protein
MAAMTSHLSPLGVGFERREGDVLVLPVRGSECCARVFVAKILWGTGGRHGRSKL